MGELLQVQMTDIFLCKRGKLAKDNRKLKKRVHLLASPCAGLRELAKRKERNVLNPH